MRTAWRKVLYRVYLDNAATTAALPSVADAVAHALMREYGNPSSLHQAGVAAEEIITAARRRLATALAVPEREIYFTSGGTEGDNMAIIGVAKAYARRGRHIVTSAIEHAALLSSCAALAAEGWHVTHIKVNNYGIVAQADVAAAVTDETTLVSIMAVNNEVGAVQPLPEIAAAVRRRRPDVILHTDAVQALGKIPLDLRRWGYDMATVSAHKIHGPKGCGALWVRDGIRLQPIMHGGSQERGQRPGTENVPGIAGFLAALEALDISNASRQPQGQQQMRALRNQLITGVLAALPGSQLNGPVDDNAAPHIANISFPGIRAEVMLHALAARGVYVSAGAACSAAARKASHVLQAIGLPPGRIASALRFSLSPLTTAAEIDQAIAAVTAVGRELGSWKEDSTQ